LFLLVAAALNLVAVALFVMGYRARPVERLLRVERLALTWAQVTLLASALLVVCFFVLFIDNPFEALLAAVAPALLPFSAWLGLVLLRSSRAAADQAESR